MKIITVTLNPCLDVSYNMDGAFKVGELNRVNSPIYNYSGKGINVSRRLKSLGSESTILTFSFGDDGEKMIDSLRSEGLCVWDIKCEGKLRRNVAVLDCNGGATEINEKGSPVSEEKLCELIAALKSELNTPDEKLLVLSGSIAPGIPQDIYKKLCKIGKNSDAYVVLDCDGEMLKTGLEAMPDLIKPNRRELSELCSVDLSGSGEAVRIEAVRTALEFCRNEGTAVLCTLDEDGSVYAGPGGSFMCQAVRGEIKSFKGAGDAFLATFLYEYIINSGDCEMAMIKASAKTTQLLCAKEN